MSIRPATESDLDAITWIAVAATSDVPVNQYRSPYMHDYPEDYFKYTRIRYGEVLATGNGTIMVFESPSHENPTVKKPVAFSIWLRPPGRHVEKSPVDKASETKPKTKVPPDPPERRDANPARMIALSECADRAKGKLFDKKYGEKQLYLGMLACHPDYQKRGAGNALCQWGLATAKAEDLTITLFASPAGIRLYTKLGFKLVGSFRTQVDGEDEYLDSPAMVLEATNYMHE
ncbi:hypothetical protein MMC18_000705 [Xylographa bjoerkii]|nr:hypothetical protein [Xylographa bjoerkii]